MFIEQCLNNVVIMAEQHCGPSGPDNISPRILREFAHEFANPVSIIFKKSLNSQKGESGSKSLSWLSV